MTSSSTGTKHKPALDESSFQQLLAAAYVVQQHHEDVRGKGSESGTSQILSAIAEIQSLIRAQNLDIPASAGLIAARLLALTRAKGVSISLITEGYLDCVAEAGDAAKVPGSCVSSHSLVATERLKAGAIFESDNSQTDMRLDIRLCRNVGVGSLIAAPVHRFGEIAGLIEVRWSQPIGFEENDLRTCRLIAGLMSSTLERSVRIGNARAAFAIEDAPDTPAEVIEANPAETPAETSAINSVAQAETSDAEVQAAPELQIEPEPQHGSCRVCGRPFGSDEAFCGFCSMPRSSASPSEGLQSKWASLWYMQRAQGALQDAKPEELNDFGSPAVRESESRAEPEGSVSSKPTPAEPSPMARVLQARRETWADSRPSVETAEDSTSSYETPFPFEERPPVWERVSRFASVHFRESLLAAIAMLLAYGLISAWPRANNQPTWFQSLMVHWGVMQARVPTPVYEGRADARVWLDVHTQLYYCENAELYGKTPDGEFTTQHNAQGDGYQSASNEACP